MTQNEARKILLQKMEKGSTVEDFLDEVKSAIEKNDTFSNPATEADLLKPWSKSLGIAPDKLVEILVALKVL